MKITKIKGDITSEIANSFKESVAIDTEATGLQIPERDKLSLIQLCDEKGNVYIIQPNKENYKALEGASFTLPGPTIMSEMLDILNELKDKKVIGEHGIEVGKKLGYMLSGGETNPSAILNEQDLYDLEREIFIDLIKQKPTQERIRHTLDTGKPLFN